MNLRSIILPQDVQPDSLYLSKDTDNQDIIVVDQDVYLDQKAESLGTRAVYEYDIYGQLQFIGLVNDISLCGKTEFTAQE